LIHEENGRDYEKGSIHRKEKDLIANSIVCHLPIIVDWTLEWAREGRERPGGEF
jgi:hypothetical protein